MWDICKIANMCTIQLLAYILSSYKYMFVSRYRKKQANAVCFFLRRFRDITTKLRKILRVNKNRISAILIKCLFRKKSFLKNVKNGECCLGRVEAPFLERKSRLPLFIPRHLLLLTFSFLK